MPNTELLKKTLAHIETHPDQWEQEWWVTRAIERVNPACGTAYCYAGHAVVLSGYEVSAEGEVEYWKLPDNVRVQIDPDYVYQSDDTDQPVAEVAHVASALLGIREFYTPGRHLFDAHNTLDDIRQFVAELCSEASS